MYTQSLTVSWVDFEVTIRIDFAFLSFPSTVATEGRKVVCCVAAII